VDRARGEPLLLIHLIGGLPSEFGCPTGKPSEPILSLSLEQLTLF